MRGGGSGGANRTPGMPMLPGGAIGARPFGAAGLDDLTGTAAFLVGAGFPISAHGAGRARGGVWEAVPVTRGACNPPRALASKKKAQRALEIRGHKKGLKPLPLP